MDENERTPAKVIVEALVAEGVEYVFGLVGSHVLDIYDALIDVPQIRHVVAKHENNAAYMAEMYGRLTGKPGIVVVTAGPGALNSISAVAQAYQNGTPMVHISGTVPLSSGVAEFHGTDRPDFLAKTFAEVTKWSIRVERPWEVPSVMARAFRVAVEGRPGPVHVEFPYDVLRNRQTSIPSYERQVPVSVAIDQERLRALARRLAGARRPVLCIGRGILTHRVTGRLVELAERLGAAVMVAGDALGAFPETHPLFAGSIEAYRLTPSMEGWLQRADVVLVLGMREGSRDIRAVRKVAPAHAVSVSLAESPADGEEGDLSFDERLLDALLAELTRGGGQADGRWREELEAERVSLHDQLRATLEPYRNGCPVHFGVAIESLVRQLDERAIVVTGTGNHREWARWLVPVRHPFSQVPEGLWGTMGWELPGAIAAKLVHPDRQVVAVTGDGSLLMSSSDLVTAVETGANVLIVVMNDACYGMIESEQKKKFGRLYGVALRSVDFVAMAESCGAKGFRVERPSDLDGVFRQAIEATQHAPVIVDVVAGTDYPCPDALGLAQRQPEGLDALKERVLDVARRVKRTLVG